MLFISHLQLSRMFVYGHGSIKVNLPPFFYYIKKNFQLKANLFVLLFHFLDDFY